MYNLENKYFATYRKLKQYVNKDLITELIYMNLQIVKYSLEWSQRSCYKIIPVSKHYKASYY